MEGATGYQNNAGTHGEQPPTGQHTYPCRECQNHCNSGIKCGKCQMWVHYICSEVPIYLLVALVKSNRRYTCRECTKEGIATYDATFVEIKKNMQEEEHRGIIIGRVG